MTLLSSLIIPAAVLAAGVLMLVRRDGFESFTRGAARGMKTVFGILPAMTALCVALSMFSSSGAVDIIVRLASPVTSALGLPAEALPLIVTRPVSGSASSAAFAELLKTSGADSPAALISAVIMGSSDTLIYVIAVYFGKTRVKSAGRAFAIAAACSVLCVFLSSFLVRLFLL